MVEMIKKNRGALPADYDGNYEPFGLDEDAEECLIDDGDPFDGYDYDNPPKSYDNEEDFTPEEWAEYQAFIERQNKLDEEFQKELDKTAISITRIG